MSDPVEMRVGAERCYWSVIDAAGVGGGPLPRALLDEAAMDFPVGGEDLVAVCAEAGGTRLLVCAVKRSALEAVPAGAVSYRPNSIPGGLGVTADVGELEFLVGEFLAAPVRRARARRHVVRAAALLMAAGLVAIGLARRAAEQEEIGAAARLEAEARLAELAPGAPPAAALGRVDVELSSLRRGARAARLAAPPPDAALTLASVLNGWPARNEPGLLSLNVGPGSVTATVELGGDPGTFLSAVRAPAGWVLDEPRVSAGGGTTRVGLSMRPARVEGARGAAP